MKWAVTAIVVFVAFGLTLPLWATGGDGPLTMTYYVTLEEGEHRRDIDFGVIASSSTTSSSTTLTSTTNPNGTTTTDPVTPSSTTSTTDPSLTGTTSPTPPGTPSTTTTTSPTPSTGTDPTPTTRNRQVLALVLMGLATYWLWKRRAKDDDPRT